MSFVFLLLFFFEGGLFDWVYPSEWVCECSIYLSLSFLRWFPDRWGVEDECVCMDGVSQVELARRIILRKIDWQDIRRELRSERERERGSMLLVRG